MGDTNQAHNNKMRRGNNLLNFCPQCWTKNVEISLNDRSWHFSIVVKVTSLSYNNSEKVQSPLFFNNLGS